LTKLGIDLAVRAPHVATLTDERGNLIWKRRRFSNGKPTWWCSAPPSGPTGLARPINVHFVNAFDVAASVAEYFQPGEK
jgi:hypothetical protein